MEQQREHQSGQMEPELFARSKAQAAKAALPEMTLATTEEKNQALRLIAQELGAATEEILAANALDVQEGERAGLGAKIDRLVLTRERIEAIQADIANVIELPDPIGAVLDTNTRPNGLRVSRVRTPLGVIGIIYESRPNVTVDASVLCLKSGNTVVLKGGSDAIHSNRAIVGVLRRALEKSALPVDAVQLLDSTDRAVTGAFLKLRGLLDVIIPRGGLNLIRFTQENAQVPVIETGASVVHAYVDEEVDVPQAAALIMNAKTRRVSICGALDVLLVHRKALDALMSALVAPLAATDPMLEVRADARALPCLQGGLKPQQLKPLDVETDYDTEWVDHKLAIGVVDSMEEAMAHIRAHSLGHTEAIYTTNPAQAERFLAAVDAAVVMHNASTQFTDGAQFGLGAEIGISTQKLHVRGPFALEGLTSSKWHVRGQGQTRP